MCGTRRGGGGRRDGARARASLGSSVRPTQLCVLRSALCALRGLLPRVGGFATAPCVVVNGRTCARRHVPVLTVARREECAAAETPLSCRRFASCAAGTRLRTPPSGANDTLGSASRTTQASHVAGPQHSGFIDAHHSCNSCNDARCDVRGGAHRGEAVARAAVLQCCSDRAFRRLVCFSRSTQLHLPGDAGRPQLNAHFEAAHCKSVLGQQRHNQRPVCLGASHSSNGVDLLL